MDAYDQIMLLVGHIAGVRHPTLVIIIAKDDVDGISGQNEQPRVVHVGCGVEGNARQHMQSIAASKESGVFVHGPIRFALQQVVEIQCTSKGNPTNDGEGRKSEKGKDEYNPSKPSNKIAEVQPLLISCE